VRESLFEYIGKSLKDMAHKFVTSRLLLLVLLFCIAFGLLINRLFYLQIVRGPEFAQDHILTIRKSRDLPGTRGNIYDRNGVLLAYNELTNVVIFEDYHIVRTGDRSRNEILNEVLLEIKEIVESNGDVIIDNFGISLNAHNEYHFVHASETSRLRFVADVFGESFIDDLSDEQRNASAEDIIYYLATNRRTGYGIYLNELPRDVVLSLVTMRYAIALHGFQQYIPTILATDVSDSTVISIMENMARLPGVSIDQSSLRRYAHSHYVAALMGYTGPISLEELEAMPEEQRLLYSLTDTVGKSGIELAMEEVLRGSSGEKVFLVDRHGRVTDVVSHTEPGVGNNVHLTIDIQWQKYAYRIAEEKMAGILLSRLTPLLEYDPRGVANASHIMVPVGDAYFNFIANNIIDSSRFGSADAGPAEQIVHTTFATNRDRIMTEIRQEMANPEGLPLRDLPIDMQQFLNHIVRSILMGAPHVLMWELIDINDPTHQAWITGGNINFYQYLHHAISQDWIDTSQLVDFIPDARYFGTEVIFHGVLNYIQYNLLRDRVFDQLIYRNLIRTGHITGGQIFAIVYEQEVLPMDEGIYLGLLYGGYDPFTWLYRNIYNMVFTPGQLALYPSTVSVVINDPNTGEVLALVSYPGFDNNRLANTVDNAYFYNLSNNLSRPFYNSATQQRTAPGSTYKMITAVAALSEGIIDYGKFLLCRGEFDLVEPSPRCWIYPGEHGGLEVVQALSASCNVFFYHIGFIGGFNELGSFCDIRGTDFLARYADAFGLGSVTGLEVPETPPQISDEIAILTAIGQGNNNFTVSQLSRYAATVANRGESPELTLVLKTTDPNGLLITRNQTNRMNELDHVTERTWDLIHQGMREMVLSHGSTRGQMGIPMAGKTGTAQQSLINPDHGLFVGFAPIDNPEIAIAIRITNGYTSAYAVDLARDIVNLLYGFVEEDEVITGTATPTELHLGVQQD